MILCMSIVPGYSGQPFMPDAYGRIEHGHSHGPGGHSH